MRKTIDRLQHVNEKDVIPAKLIKSKNMSSVTSFIFEMISSDGDFKKFDKPLDDDPRYVAQISETAEDRFKKFLWENNRETKISTIRFLIKGQGELNEVIMVFLFFSNFFSYQNVSIFKKFDQCLRKVYNSKHFPNISKYIPVFSSLRIIH